MPHVLNGMRIGARTGVVAALGVAQTLAWASSYYLAAMLAAPMARDLGISVSLVFGAFSFALIVSALLGPYAGRAIDRWGGRPVLMGTSLVFAAGLASLAAAQGPVSLFTAWMLIGIGMGAGLYEAAFSALGLPLNASLPKISAAGRSQDGAHASPDIASADGGTTPRARLAAGLLAFVFAATWFISTAMAAHLPRLLQAGGATLGMAVAVGALVGPAQVAGRLLEFGFLRRVHPLLSARIAALAHPVGAAALLLAGAPLAALFGILHGAGNGILTIAKGTLPLVLFGPHGYGARQGLLMVPARIAQAFAPLAFGLCLDRWGVGALWLSAALGLAAFGALLVLPRGVGYGCHAETTRGV
jgi:hypothetical protein